MPTVTITTRPDSASPGRVRPCIRCHAQAATAYATMGVSVKASEWNAKRGEVRAAHGHADLINAVLARMAAAAETAMLSAMASGEPVTAAAMKAAALAAAGRAPEERMRGDLIHDVDEMATSAESGDAFSSAKAWRSLAALLREYAGSDALPYHTAAAASWLRAFDAWAKREKKHAQNTRAKHWARLRQMAQAAVKRRDAPPEALDAFDAFRVSREETQKTYLTAPEVTALEAWHATAPDGPARDAAGAFLLSLMLLGMRVGDVLLLSPSSVRMDGGVPVEVSYRMGKNAKTKRIALGARARTLVASMLAGRAGSRTLIATTDTYPLGTARERAAAVAAGTAMLNKYLKQAAAAAGIRSGISMHVARYTLGALAQGAGFTDAEIQAAYAHGSASVTDGYIGQLRREAIDARVASRLFGD